MPSNSDQRQDIFLSYSFCRICSRKDYYTVLIMKENTKNREYTFYASAMVNGWSFFCAVHPTHSYEHAIPGITNEKVKSKLLCDIMMCKNMFLGIIQHHHSEKERKKFPIWSHTQLVKIFSAHFETVMIVLCFFLAKRVWTNMILTVTWLETYKEMVL